MIDSRTVDLVDFYGVLNINILHPTIISLADTSGGVAWSRKIIITLNIPKKGVEFGEQ